MNNFASLRRLVRRYRLYIRIFAGLAMTTSILGPASLYFAGYAPPLFPPIGYAMSVASAIVIVLTLAKSSRDTKAPQGVRLLTLFMIVSVTYLVSYSVLTVSPPKGRDGARMQTGLTLRSWSVTDETHAWLTQAREQGIDVDKQFALMSRGAYESGGLHGSMRVWRPWVVVVCGVWLVGLFISSFVLWALVMGRLISVLKHMKLSEAEDILSIFF